jgi:hypothetical protein
LGETAAKTMEGDSRPLPDEGWDLDVQGFQSVLLARILVRGLTVLTGRTNVGKSSVIRAPMSLFQGLRGMDHVSLGEKESLVSVRFPDSSVACRKREKSTRYTIDGRDYDRAGTQVPDEALSSAGVRPVDKDGAVWPQFLTQKEMPFLLRERSPSLVASIIGSDRESRVAAQAARASAADQAEAGRREQSLREALAQAERRRSEISAAADGILDPPSAELVASLTGAVAVAIRLVKEISASGACVGPGAAPDGFSAESSAEGLRLAGRTLASRMLLADAELPDRPLGPSSHEDAETAILLAAASFSRESLPSPPLIGEDPLRLAMASLTASIGSASFDLSVPPSQPQADESLNAIIGFLSVSVDAGRVSAIAAKADLEAVEAAASVAAAREAAAFACEVCLGGFGIKEEVDAGAFQGCGGRDPGHGSGNPDRGSGEAGKVSCRAGEEASGHLGAAPRLEG